MFGSHSKENISVTEDVMQKLKGTEEMLEKKQEYLDMKYDVENAKARKHARTNKRLALQALKRRKPVEEQLRKIDGAITILEFQREALENAETNIELWKTLRYALLEPHRSPHQAFHVDDVRGTLGDIHEQTEISKEISEALCDVGSKQDFDVADYDELGAELEAIAQEVHYCEVFGMECYSFGLPDFPSNVPVLTKKKLVGPWSM